jgi:hypothetical protein
LDLVHAIATIATMSAFPPHVGVHGNVQVPNELVDIALEFLILRTTKLVTDRRLERWRRKGRNQIPNDTLGLRVDQVRHTHSVKRRVKVMCQSGDPTASIGKADVDAKARHAPVHSRKFQETHLIARGEVLNPLVLSDELGGLEEVVLRDTSPACVSNACTHGHDLRVEPELLERGALEPVLLVRGHEGLLVVRGAAVVARRGGKGGQAMQLEVGGRVGGIHLGGTGCRRRLGASTGREVVLSTRLGRCRRRGRARHALRLSTARGLGKRALEVHFWDERNLVDRVRERQASQSGGKVGGRKASVGHDVLGGGGARITLLSHVLPVLVN